MRLLNNLKLRFAEYNRNTMLVMAEGALASAVLNLTSPFYQLFARTLGAGDFAVGLINSLPALFAILVLLPASSYIDSVPDKKRLLMRMILLCGLTLPLFALAPYLGAFGVWFFIACVALWNVPYILYTVSWQSYFTDLFEPRGRSVPYAMRMAVSNVIPTVTILGGGLVVSYLCQSDAQKIIAYQLFFLLACAASWYQMRAIGKTSPDHASTPSPQSFGLLATFPQAVRELKKNKVYLRFLLLLFAFYFSWQMAWPLFFIYLMDVVGVNEALKCLIDVSGLIPFAVCAAWWGKRIQKRGPGSSTVIGLLGSAIMPLWTVLTTSPPVIMSCYIFGGFTGPGFQIGLFNDMLQQLPEQNKTLNIGIYNTVIQVSGFVAPLFGVAVYRMIGIRQTMILSSALRLTCALLFLARHLLRRRKQAAESAPV